MTLAAVNTVYVVMFLQSLVPTFISLSPASHFNFPTRISKEECPTFLVASLTYPYFQNRISQDINKAIYLLTVIIFPHVLTAVVGLGLLYEVPPSTRHTW